MKLLLRSDDQKAFGSTVDVAGVVFRVAALVVQGYCDKRYWVYELEPVGKSPSGADKSN